MRPIVIGTAGHIDHGKTSLVFALTGVNTDRLKEEQERGITIELGFTHLVLPSGLDAGFVDVPGHERFVRQMIAGATGIDVVLLVVASDEGVMPQTREHLDILTLLGVKSGIVVLTKADLVDSEFMELVQLDVAELVEGTFLEDAPVIPFSSITGQGKSELLQHLDQAAERVQFRPTEGPTRLPVDRVFSRKGFGTVVTGTLVRGTIHPGDTLELSPSGKKVRVRGIQVHGREMTRASAGMRTAINLQGVEKVDVDRGDVLTTPGSLTLSTAADIYTHVVPSSPFTLGRSRMSSQGSVGEGVSPMRVRILTGTLECLALLTPVGPNPLLPGESGYAQLRFERPIPLAVGDTLIIRSESPLTTLAGGTVIDTSARRLRRREWVTRVELLRQLHLGDTPTRVKCLLEKVGATGATRQELSRLSGLVGEDLAGALSLGQQQGWAVPVGESWFYQPQLQHLRDAMLLRLDHFHHTNSLSSGISAGELRPSSRVPDLLLTHLLAQLVAEAQIQGEGALYHRIGFSPRLNEGEQKRVEWIKKELLEAHYSPPLVPELLRKMGEEGLPLTPTDPLLPYLITSGQVVRIKDDLWLHPRAVATLEESVTTFLREKGQMGPADFKDLTGLSRKYAIPLLEYLDRIRLTLRVGDVRHLRGS